MLPALVAAALALGSPGISRAQEQPDTAPEVVSIRFDWPVGLTANVTASQQRQREAAGKLSDFKMEAAYRLDVAVHEDGLLIASSDYRISDFSSEPSLAPLGDLQTQLSEVSPNYVVNRAGELLELQGLDELVRRSRALLSPMLDSLESLSAEAASLIESMLSERYFMRRVAEDWNAIVGLWVGAEFEVGAIYALEESEPSPVLPNVLIPFYYEFALSGYAPCHESAPPRSCVVLEMVSYPDPDEVKRLLSDVMQQIAGPQLAGQIVFEELEVENTVTLVTEPSTLIPHSVELARAMVGKIRVPDGEGGEFRQVDRRSYRYDYMGKR